MDKKEDKKPIEVIKKKVAKKVTKKINKAEDVEIIEEKPFVSTWRYNHKNGESKIIESAAELAALSADWKDTPKPEDND